MPTIRLRIFSSISKSVRSFNKNRVEFYKVVFVLVLFLRLVNCSYDFSF